MKQIVTVLLVLGFTSACMGGGDGGSGSNVGPGDENYKPNPVDNGGGKPPGATSFTCSTADDCDYWYCRCADGFVVNSANCTNGYCLDAASSCPDACEYFNHGEWTGIAGGGPTTPDKPDGGTNNQCGQQGGTDPVCWQCTQEECCSETAACYDNPDCLDYWDCLYDCGIDDPTCASICADTNPWGVDDFESMSICIRDRCSLDC